MVKSGLVDNPHVSQYRLTAHLGMAVFIYGFIFWTVLDLLAPVTSQPKHLKRFAYSLSGLIFLMILSGGLVAGTRAGIPYPTWPLMGDSFIPPGLYSLQPFWLSAFEDMLTIQFNHRMFAYLIVGLVCTFAYQALKSDLKGSLKVGIYCFIGLLFLQVSLGISTLIFYIPVPVAAAHQVCAVALLSASLFVSHCFARQSATTVP
jgi:cytochrome c oxidase assembly protein subunit 15